MTDRYFQILRDSCHIKNYIPSGRQLHRTPPLADVKRHLDFCNEAPSEDRDGPQQNMQAGTRDQDDDQNRTFAFKTPETKTDDPNSMLKGMKGYQLTPSDLEFIKKMKEEKLIKKLQGDLKEVQRLLKKEMMAAELTCASKKKAQAELKKFPSSEELAEWVTVVLKMASPSTELADLDTKSLIAMVTKEDLQRAMAEKRIELPRLEKMVAHKRKTEAKERGQLEKQIASERLNIQRLMSQLSDLKSELAQQQEAYKALEKQNNGHEAPEIQVADEAETSELQAAKTQVKPRGRQRKRPVQLSDKLQDATDQSKSARSKHADGKRDNRTTVKDHANKNTSETLKTKQTSGAAAERPTLVKAARGLQKKLKEEESNPQECVQAARGRRRPPGTALQTASLQLRNLSTVKPGDAESTSQQAAASRSRKKAAAAATDAGDEAPNAGLRRSKRIANRT